MRNLRILGLLPPGFVIMLSLLYNNWLLAPMLNPHISSARSLISEISARTQPNHWIFQLLDCAAGAATLLVLPYVWRYLRRNHNQYSWLLLATFAIIGLDPIIDALLPISCSPSVDLHCQLINNHSLITSAHMLESTVVGIITALAPLVWWWHHRRKLFIATASFGFAFLQLAVGLGIIVAFARHAEVIGLLQRTYELGISLWVAFIVTIAAGWSYNLYREPELEPVSEPI